jgi:hypothetical protein
MKMRGVRCSYCEVVLEQVGRCKSQRKRRIDVFRHGQVKEIGAHSILRVLSEVNNTLVVVVVVVVVVWVTEVNYILVVLVIEVNPYQREVSTKYTVLKKNVMYKIKKSYTASIIHAQFI